MRTINRRHIFLFILLLAFLGIFLPIRLPYSFKTTGFVFPSRVWQLNRGQDDSFISELHDHENMIVSQLKSYKFERGDIAELVLDERVGKGGLVNQGDTIAFIHSFYIENEITRLENLRDIEIANLEAESSGEKQSLINQAKKEYEFARQQYELQKKIYDRQKKLFNDSIISRAEFEVYENAFDLARINTEIAENNLLTIKTGKKESEIELIMQRIRSFEREIETLEKQKQRYFIITPVTGILTFNNEINGVLKVSDTGNYILRMAVKVSESPYLGDISSIGISLPGNDAKYGASLIDVEEDVNTLANQQMIIAKARIENESNSFFPGMAVHCKVVCDKVTILEHLKRGINLNL